jgi:hypothetical protein
MKSLAMVLLLAAAVPARAQDAAPSAATLAEWSRDCPALSSYLAAKKPSPKKGLGVSRHYASGTDLLAYVGASWYYDWTAVPVPGATGEFVPLLQYPQSANDDAILAHDLGAIPPGTVNLLGFNEPDLGPRMPAPPTPKEAETVLKRLLPMLSNTAAVGPLIGTPALASPVIRSAPAPWLAEYMGDGAPADFVTAHFYPSIAIGPRDTEAERSAKVDRAARTLIDGVKTLESSYPGKNIWITEMGLMDLAANAERPARFGPKDEACFMAQVLPPLEADPRVARYAWFSADPQAAQPLYPTLPGALFSGGRPTPLAELYR